MSGIDKLIVRIPRPNDEQSACYSVDEVRNFSERNGLLLRLVKLDRQWALGIKDARTNKLYKGVHFKRHGGERGHHGIPIGGHLTYIITNPSRFHSYDEMMDLLERLNTGWLYDPRCKAVRIDCAADYAVAHPDVASGLLIPHKRMSTTYDDYNSGRPSTIYIGRKPDCISVYDRNLLFRPLQRTIPFWTRIERQIHDRKVLEVFGGNINFLNLDNVLIALSRGNIRPLSTLVQNELRFTPRHLLTQSQADRQAEFRTLVRAMGFFRTRKMLYLQTNKNFDRLYGALYRLTPFPPWEQPGEIFRYAVMQFYSGTPVRLGGLCATCPDHWQRTPRGIWYNGRHLTSNTPSAFERLRRTNVTT